MFDQPYIILIIGLLAVVGAFFAGSKVKRKLDPEFSRVLLDEDEDKEKYDSEEKIMALIQENRLLAIKWENISKSIRTLGAIKDREMLANSVARMVREEFNIPYAAVLLRQGNVFKAVSTEGLHALSADRLTLSVNDPMVRYFKTYTSITVINKNDKQFKNFSEIQETFHEIVVMPLVVGDDMRGLIWVATKPGTPDFSEVEKKILSYLGMAVGYMINNIEAVYHLDRRALNIIIGMAKAAEQRTEYSVGHSERVSAYAGMFARHYGLSYQEVESIKRAGLMHDIGKIGISETILNKPDRLTEAEFQQMKAHPIYAAELIKTLGFLKQEQLIILHHHEKFDGTGYPNGLRGNQIPIGSAILSLADVFDALTRKQVYRDAFTIDETLKIMGEMGDKNFDSSLLSHFLTFVKERLKNVQEVSEFNS
jgi:HD-GYP domain-containing protein (c-di-GMP phosphodiesterase class II)